MSFSDLVIHIHDMPDLELFLRGMTDENSVLRLQRHLQVEVSEQVKLRQSQIKDFYYRVKRVLRVCSVLGKFESDNILQIKQRSTEVNSNK